MELSNFTANCTKSAQFAYLQCKSHEICAICANLHSQQIAQNLHDLPTLNANHVKSAQSVSIFQSSLYPWAKLPKFMIFALFRKLCKIHQPFFNLDHGKMELSNFTANCAKSAQFAHPQCESREICAICTNFHLQQNCAKSAQFAHPHRESREICAICANFHFFVQNCMTWGFFS